jgi:predicted DNA-binding transcriptional regulator AlpA
MSPSASAVDERFEKLARHGIAAVERRVGVERSTISRHCKAGTFPRPMYWGNRRYWTERQLSEWEDEQLARQDEAELRARSLLDKAHAALGRVAP